MAAADYDRCGHVTIARRMLGTSRAATRSPCNNDARAATPTRYKSASFGLPTDLIVDIVRDPSAREDFYTGLKTPEAALAPAI